MLIELGQRSPFLTSRLRSFGKDRSKRKANRRKSFLALRCLPGLLSSAPLAFISWRLPLLCHCASGCSGAIRGTTFPCLPSQLRLHWETRLLPYPEQSRRKHPRCCPAWFAFVGSRAEWLLYVVPKLQCRILRFCELFPCTL